MITFSKLIARSCTSAKLERSRWPDYCTLLQLRSRKTQMSNKPQCNLNEQTFLKEFTTVLVEPLISVWQSHKTLPCRENCANCSYFFQPKIFEIEEPYGIYVLTVASLVTQWHWEHVPPKFCNHDGKCFLPNAS